MVTINKLWEGADGATGDLQDALNWYFVSLVNPTFKWTVSGSGTNEYYLDLFGGGDPGILEPPNVYENETTALVAGTVGSLSAGEWDFGNTDTLGFNTIYVRLTSGAADPDSRTAGYVQLRDIPRTGDKVRVPAGSAIISSNLDLSATTLVDWIFEQGHATAVGTAEDYLRITISGLFRFHSTGRAYIDLAASTVSPQILGTKSGGTGTVGLELIGSALTALRVEGGDVGLAFRHGTTATVGTITQTGGKLTIGAGATVSTSLTKEGGACVDRKGTTTITHYGGTYTSEEAAAITTLNQNGGTVIHNSTGTIGTANLNDGTIDHQQGTITTLNHARTPGGTYRRRSGTTLTTYAGPAAPTQIDTSPL